MQSLVITNKGQALISKLIAGTATATFTKIQVSDSDYSSASLEDLEALDGVKQTELVSSVTVTDTSLVEVLSRIDNHELTDGYYVRILGLFAKDSETDEEILYGVSLADTNPDYMPAFGGKTVTGISYRLNVKVDNSASVDLTIDPAAVPTMEQILGLQETIQEVNTRVDDTNDALDDIIKELGQKDISKIDDGTITGAITSFYAFMKHIQDGAAAHNGIYVNEDITDMWNDGTFSRNVQNGTFKDIFPGMYITKQFNASGLENVTEDFVVADLDYHLHHGDTETTAHHALMVMKNGSSVTHKMNASNTTAGGYTGSDMWKNIIPKYAAAMQNAFGSGHILSHRELLTNAQSASGASMAGAGLTGYASGWTWFDVLFNIMNNAMRFGVTATSSSFYDTGDCTKQLALFQLANDMKIAHLGKGGQRYWDWLRDVASATGFAICHGNGGSHCHAASNACALRGYFLLR